MIASLFARLLRRPSRPAPATSPGAPPGVAHFSDTGRRNRIEIGANCRIAKIVVTGDDNTLVIGDGCRLGGAITIKADGATVMIGAGTTAMGLNLSMHEAETLTIGRDCMFSLAVFMDVSDMHPIFDVATGERLNPPAPITIADHVWLANGVRVMKGATIGADAVVGAGSLVTGDLPANCIAAGTPARVQRTGTTWNRHLPRPTAR